MFYLSLTLDCYKTSLGALDYVVLVSAWGAIFSSFATTWGLDALVSTILTSASVLLMGAALLLNYFLALKAKKISDLEGSSKSRSTYQMVQSTIITRRFKCSENLIVLFPMFPLIYFLGVGGVIGKDVSTAIIMILNYVVKLSYSITVIDSHLEVLDPNSHQLRAEKHANEARRSFLRCKHSSLHHFFSAPGFRQL